MALQQVPVEYINRIIECLSPKQRFHIATDLRLGITQRQCIPVLPFAQADYASAKGQCDLLDVLWSNYNTLVSAIKYSVSAIQKASMYGHVPVLEWWKTRTTNHAVLFGDQRQRKAAIMPAIARGHLHVLMWWKEYDDSFFDSLTGYAMETASLYGHVLILDWWKKCGFNAVDWRNRPRTLGLWSETAIEFATRDGHVAVLQWWKDNFEWEFTPWTGPSPFRNFGCSDLTDEQIRLVKQWWKEHGGFDEEAKEEEE